MAFSCFEFLKIPKWPARMRSGGCCRKMARVYDRTAREDLNRRRNNHGAKNRDFGRNGSRRLRSRVPNGEGWGTRPDRLAGGGTCAGDGEALARAHWRRRPDRGNGQSFSGSRVRYRCLDSSLLRRGGAAQAIEERVEAGNDCDRYDCAPGGNRWRVANACARSLAKLGSRANARAFTSEREFFGSVPKSWRGCACE